MDWIIVGLGNPGAQYDQTRHNIGFAVIDQLARQWQMTLHEERRYKGNWAVGTPLGNQKIHLLKPTTFMNLSGQAVRPLMTWHKLLPTQVLIIYDEMALPVGRLRLRKEGSAGGHNGMKSLIEQLGTPNFPRLRLGIGQPPPGQETVSYVLGRFTPTEQKTIVDVVTAAVAAVELMIKQDLDTAMNTYNSWQA